MLRLIDNQEQNRIVFLETSEHKLLELRFYLPNVSTSHPHHLHHATAAAEADLTLVAAEAAEAAEDLGFLLIRVKELLLLTPLRSPGLKLLVLKRKLLDNRVTQLTPVVAKSETITGRVKKVKTLWHKLSESLMILEYSLLVLTYILLLLMILGFQSLLNFVQ